MAVDKTVPSPTARPQGKRGGPRRGDGLGVKFQGSLVRSGRKLKISEWAFARNEGAPGRATPGLRGLGAIPMPAAVSGRHCAIRRDGTTIFVLAFFQRDQAHAGLKGISWLIR